MTPNVPDSEFGEIEGAQAALRDGLARAKILVREARRAIRQRDVGRPEPPTAIPQCRREMIAPTAAIRSTER